MRKNCETCKYDSRLRKEICDDCYNTIDAPTKWEQAKHYKPDTNAERIRAMSDEELSEFLESTHTNMAIKLGGEYIVRSKEYIAIWLKQPAKE